MAEKLVSVSWYGCNCAEEIGYTLKYCDEHHREYAMVPISVLNSYR